MDGLTVQQAARATGWSARMLRYVERSGLVVPRRSEHGYRLYGAEDLKRLRSLRDLLGDWNLQIDDVRFARRLQVDERLRRRVDAWLRGTPGAEPSSPSVPVDQPADQPSALEWLVATPRSHERLRFVA